MLSLDNAFSYDALRDWDRRVREGTGREDIEYIAEHKFDGLSISLQYEDGLLVRGVTRGDGTTGEDVTPNVKTIRSIPLSVDAAGLKKAKLAASFEVRGEILMTRKAFEALNRQQEEIGGKIFVNARNSAAGAVRVLDPAITAQRKLDFFAYYLFVDGKVPYAKHSESLQVLKQLRFRASDDWKLCAGIDKVIDYCTDWDEKREKLPYEIDGVVIKVNSTGLAERAGVYIEGASLGHCLQISRAPGNHGGERHHRAGGANGHADAGGGAGAGAGGRRHCQPFHTPQYG